VSDLQDFLNDIAFRVRGGLRWSAPAWRWRRGSWARVRAGLDENARARAAELRGGVGADVIDGWGRHLDDRQLLENLYVLDLLERHLPGARGPGLEVGAKNGAILPALVAAVPAPWDQVELDAHRRYLDLSTRRGHGERVARAHPGCRFVAGSVEDLQGQYGVVVWFLPFLFEEPLAAWGLPRRFFAPAALFAHVVARVAPGGTLFIANQGEAERDRQQQLFDELALTPQSLGRLESPLSPFRRPRFGFRWTAPASAR
jgi:hypothetical protein